MKQPFVGGKITRAQITNEPNWGKKKKKKNLSRNVCARPADTVDLCKPLAETRRRNRNAHDKSSIYLRARAADAFCPFSSHRLVNCSEHATRTGAIRKRFLSINRVTYCDSSAQNASLAVYENRFVNNSFVKSYDRDWAACGRRRRPRRIPAHVGVETRANPRMCVRFRDARHTYMAKPQWQ